LVDRLPHNLSIQTTYEPQILVLTLTVGILKSAFVAIKLVFGIFICGLDESDISQKTLAESLTCNPKDAAWHCAIKR
jgi:hypothetical protein